MAPIIHGGDFLIPTDERISSQEEIFRAALDTISEKIRVALPAIVERFDQEKQTVDVQIALREKILLNGETKEIEIPLVCDIPVYFAGGQGFDITIPVEVGDECLIIFADMCIDAWWEAGGIQNQTEKRRHDLSDGFALVGFRSQKNLPEKYKSDAIVISAQDSIVEIYKDKVNIDSKNISLTSETINLTSNSVLISANQININGELIINGEPYNNHMHTGVKSGASNTGGKV